VSLGTGRESAAKAKKCPKCPKPKPFCPQRVCCSCNPPDGETFRDCRLLAEGTTNPTDCFQVTACQERGGHFVVPVEGYSTFCDDEQQCVKVGCAELP
jgi:hypothetical protein